MQKCPYCGEEIQAGASTCEHCGRDLKDYPAAQQFVTRQSMRPSRESPALGIGCAVIVLAILLGFVLFQRRAASLQTAGALSPAESAWDACRDDVQQQLSLPASQARPYNEGRVTDLGGSKYRANVFYPTKNITYQCIVLRSPAGNMQVLDLRAKPDSLPGTPQN